MAKVEETTPAPMPKAKTTKAAPKKEAEAPKKKVKKTYKKKED